MIVVIETVEQEYSIEAISAKYLYQPINRRILAEIQYDIANIKNLRVMHEIPTLHSAGYDTLFRLEINISNALHF